jgi:hypothetical protein
MEHVPHQGEVQLSLCSMVYLHNISKPSSYNTHILCLHYNDNQSILFWDNFFVNYVNYKTHINTSRGGVTRFWMFKLWANVVIAALEGLEKRSVWFILNLTFLNEWILQSWVLLEQLKTALLVKKFFFFFFSVWLPVANAPDVPQPCGLLYYP